MAAYIRSKTTNADEEITIQLGASTARLNQSGNFKLPHIGDADRSGIVRYNSETDKMEFNDDIELNNNELVGLGAPTMASSAANKSYVDTSIASAIASLVDGAPLVLDTLNELAAAIGDNANFVTDINASIATKLPLAGGTLTGALILNADPTANLQAATKQYVDQATSSIVTSYNDLTDKPTLFDGTYSSLSGSPNLSLVATSGLSGDLTWNVYPTEAGLPNAATKHGMFAHVHTTGHGYMAHAGNWIKLANYSDIPVGISQLSDVDTTTRIPVVGEALVWDGSNWVPGASVTAVLADASLDGGSFD